MKKLPIDRAVELLKEKYNIVDSTVCSGELENSWLVNWENEEYILSIEFIGSSGTITGMNKHTNNYFTDALPGIVDLETTELRIAIAQAFQGI